MVAIVTGKGTGLERSSAFVLGSQGQLGNASLGRDSQGVYVNAANGNLVVTRQDEFLIGLGPDVGVGRAYNSNAYWTDDNGDNWKPSATKRLWIPGEDINAAGSVVTREDWDGSLTTFAYDTSRGAYVSKDGQGAYDIIEYAGGEWHWTDGDTLIDEYYSEGNGYKITTRTDTDGNAVSYTYDGTNPDLLTRVTTASSEFIDLVYDVPTGRLQQLTTHAGGQLTRVFYEYDGLGRLSTVKVNLDPLDNSKTSGANYSTTYTYDGSSTRIASISQLDGSHISFSYTEVGEGDFRVSSYTQTVAAGVTRTTSLNYGIAGQTTVTDPAGQKTVLFYDENGNLTGISYPAESANVAPRTVQFAYDGNGDVTSVTHGPGNVVTYAYDTHGNCTLERDSAGNTVTRTYSLKNELLTETRYLVPDPDGAGAGTPSTPLTTHYVYDAESHLRYVVSAEGFITQREYDSEGRRTATDRYPGNAYTLTTFDEGTLTGFVSGLDKTTGQRTQFTYDYRGNITIETSYSRLLANGLFDTSSELTQTSYVRDQAGNLLQRIVTNPHAAGTLTESFVYDGLNRMTLATDFYSKVTRTTFLDNRAQTVVTHANGLSEISSYNHAGELIAFSTSNAGGNLIDLGGWPDNTQSLPVGNATVPGWINGWNVVDEAVWVATTGPDGLPVAAIRAGQTDMGAEGGGNVTNEVQIDGSKAYEFTYYFRLSDLDKHSVYFGLSAWGATAWVEDATSGDDNINPYFYVAGLGAQASSLSADKWYKVVAYVLPEGAATIPAGSLGGVYDVSTGQKVADTTTFRWNAERPDNKVYSRFFDFDGEANQQYSTYFYKPEIRQVTIPVTTGANLVNMSGWPGNASSPPAGNANVPGWLNYSAFTDETAWSSTTGPDGQTVVAMRAGQTDAGEEGGGNFTNLVEINSSKTYEFTYYFKLSDLNKHAVFFGLSQSAAAYVEDIATGADNGNPYFFYAWLSGQEATFTADTWYKVVGYVLPQGASAPVAPMGGVYNATTGQKVAGVSTFRWNAERPDNQVHSRFFNYYGEASQQYSTYFYQPEIRQVTPVAPLAPDIQTSLYRYDNLGRLRMTIDPTGRRQFMMYDSVGRKVADIDADGSVIEYRYDGNDNVTSTTRYGNRLSAAQLASLIDANGNPTGAAFSTLRPAADAASDRWAFQIYDAAQRLVQTIDGAGSTSVLTYDGASRLVATRNYANRVSAADIATLKTQAVNGNLWATQDAAGWWKSNLTSSPAGMIDGANAYQLAVTAVAPYEGFTAFGGTAAVGDVVTFSISVKGTATSTTASFGAGGWIEIWGDAADSTASITGPGTLTRLQGGLWMVSGLSTTVETRVTVTRRYVTAQTIEAWGYVGDTNFPATPAGAAIIVASAVVTKTSATPVFLPAADATNDRVARNFYDNDGRLTGTLDAEGYLTKIVYDKAGRKIETIAYSGVTSTTYRASGTFAQLLGSLTVDNGKDIHNWFLYDSHGRLRATIDGEGDLTRMNYNPLGELAFVETGQKLDPLPYITTPPTLGGLPSAGAAILQTASYVRDAYGNVLSETRSLTGSATTTTTSSYDDMYRLTATTTQSGGPDTRVVRQRYDLRGNVIGTLNGIGSAALAALGGSPAQAAVDAVWASYGTTLAYDRANRLISSTDPNGNRTLYYYDVDGQLAYQINAIGEATEYRFDSFGRNSDVIVYATRIQPATLTGMKGGDASAVAAVVAALGNVVADSRVQTAYDVAGQVSATRDALGHVTLYRYNSFGELATQTSAFESGLPITAFASTPAVADGSFETPEVGAGYIYNPTVAGATFTANAGIAGAGSVWGFAASPNGDQVAFVQAAGTTVASTISQTVTGLAAGNVYNLSFYLAQRPYYGANPITVSVDGVVIGTFAPGSASFTQNIVAFQAVSDTAVVTFTGSYSAVDTTTGIDQVTVSAQATWNGVQTSRAYDRRGLLKTEIADSAAGGKQITTTHGYDAFGRAITLTNALGDTTTTTYDRAGRITRITDANGKYTDFSYDARGNLYLVTDANGNKTRHVYDKAGRRFATIDALGAVTTTTYDADGRVIATKAYANKLSVGTLALEVTEATFSLPTADATNDQVTRYAYDKDGRLRFTVDGLRHVVENVYDDNGNVVSTIAYDGTIAADGSGGYTTAYVEGQISSLGLAAAPGTRVSRAAYDVANRLVYAIDSLGQVTRSKYDAKGQLITQVAFVALYTDAGTPSESAMDTWRSGHGHADDRITRVWYDNKGQLAYSIDALGYVTRIEYDGLGNVKKQSAYAALYAASDTTTVSDLDAFYATPPAGVRVTQFSYDSAGRLEQTTDPENVVTKLTLDAMGQVVASKAAFGTAAESTTTYEYDAVGRLVKQVSASGTAEASTSWFFYDGLGQLTATVDPGNYLAVRTYDATGNMLTEARYANAISGFAIGWTAAQLQTLAGASDITTSATYDAFGRVITATDARGSIVANTYDVIDQLLTQNQQMDGSTGDDDRVTAYSYDHFGNVVKVTDPRLSDSFSHYDKLGRAVRQVDATGFVTDMTYTRGGKVATIKHWATAVSGAFPPPSNPTANAAHDAVTTFTYNKRDELIATQDAEGFTESYTLNAFGERIEFRNKLHGSVVDGVTLNTTVTYTFDKRGLLLTETLPITTKTALGGTIPVKNSFEYDARGNLKKKIEADGAAEARTTNFAYDKLNRLVTTTHDAVTVVNSALVESTVTPTETLVYDTRGNVTSQTVAGAQSYFYYDHLGRVVAEVSPIGMLSRYTYDPNGNRLTAKAYETALTLPPAGNPPSGSGAYRETTFAYDRSNRLTTTTVAGLAFGVMSGSTFVTTYSGDTSTQLIYDKTGNVIAEVDGNGNVTWTWYDRANRKVAQVDRENYLTTWTLDGDGNAVSETRFATKLTSFTPPTSGSAPPGGTAHANDRTTLFEYDRNGRRTKEQRLAVAYTSINTSTGAATDVAATDSSAKSTITYTYNGLGLVLGKSVNGEVGSYIYDTIGRLTRDVGQSFTDYLVANVTPRTAYSYDGLNNVRSTRIQQDAVANDTNDRITTYTYGAGGRLASMTVTVSPSENFTRNYGYDVAGRAVVESYTRARSTAGAITEAQVTSYDIAGRVTVQTHARFNGSAWVFTDEAGSAYDAVRIQYNVFSEITGRGLTAGASVPAVFQESFSYDEAGRLWKSNEGDGVLRFHIYDKAGNRTLTLASTGATLSSLVTADVLASLNANGDTNITAATSTIAVFDKRGQQTKTIEPDRQVSASTVKTITNARTYNAFGEVLTEIDSRGLQPGANQGAYTTRFFYNTMGRLIQKIGPEVEWTNEQGVEQTGQPTEYYGYDISGRLVSVIDANGNRTTRTLLAGTGHGEGSEALVTAEFRPDTGIARSFYDVFGDKRIARSELYVSGSTTNFDEVYGYDKLGRVTSVQHRGNLLTDYYGYDGLGQRTQHWNSYLGSGVADLTDYDAKGRVVRQIDMGGDQTDFSYVWNASLQTSGLDTFGGWTRTTWNPAGKSMTEGLDYFGRTVDRIDYGGHNYDFTFDKGARLIGRTNNLGESMSWGWFNTGLIASVGYGAGNSSAYSYDVAGNRRSEWTQYGYAVVQNASATYDGLNRMIGWAEAGSTTTPAATLHIQYDLVGNVRRNLGTHAKLDNEGATIAGPFTQDYWYLYDSMNRVTLSKGKLVGTAIGLASDSVSVLVAYDKAGQRVSENRTRHEEYNFDPGNGVIIHRQRDLSTIQYFSYDAAGFMTQVRQWEEGWVLAEIPEVDAVRATFQRDAMGRVTLYQELDTETPTQGVSFSRATSYNNRSQIVSETSTRRMLDGGTPVVFTDITSNFYRATETYAGSGIWLGTDNPTAGAYMGGTVTYSKTITSRDDGNPIADTDLRQRLTWWDSARQVETLHDKDTDSNSNALWDTDYFYNASGVLTSATIDDGKYRTVSFITDANGQVMRRDEDWSGGGDPTDVRYYHAGARLAEISNNGTGNVDFSTTWYQHVMSGPPNSLFRQGATQFADFDQSFEAVNGDNWDGASSRYVANQGDTLQSIAVAVWGDASLWYLLAEANSLSGASQLAAGQSLIIPNKVANVHNNSDTFRPYDPNEAMGNLSPTSPKPTKKPKCGMMGQILIAAIAVAVSIALPHLSAFFAKGAGLIIGGMVSSAVSQAVGVATGIQEKFDWKGVAMAGITAGVGLGLNQIPGFGGSIAGSQLLGDVVSGAAKSAISQGIGVATGLQSKFSWAGVAAAGVAAGVSGAIGRSISSSARANLHEAAHSGTAPTGWAATPAWVGRSLSSAAGAIANASTRSLVSGTSFGDNIIAALPDIIANTLGTVAEGALASRSTSSTTVSTASAGSGNVVVYGGQAYVNGEPVNFNVDLSIGAVPDILSGPLPSFTPPPLDVLLDDRLPMTESRRVARVALTAAAQYQVEATAAPVNRQMATADGVNYNIRTTPGSYTDYLVIMDRHKIDPQVAGVLLNTYTVPRADGSVNTSLGNNLLNENRLNPHRLGLVLYDIDRRMALANFTEAQIKQVHDAVAPAREVHNAYTELANSAEWELVQAFTLAPRLLSRGATAIVDTVGIATGHQNVEGAIRNQVNPFRITRAGDPARALNVIRSLGNLEGGVTLLRAPGSVLDQPPPIVIVAPPSQVSPEPGRRPEGQPTPILPVPVLIGNDRDRNPPIEIVTDSNVFMTTVEGGAPIRSILDSVVDHRQINMRMPLEILGEISPRGNDPAAIIRMSRAGSRVRVSDVDLSGIDIPPMLSNKIGVADIALLETARQRNLVVITANASMVSQVRGDPNRPIAQRYGGVQILVPGRDFSSGSDLVRRLRAMGR